MATATSHEPGIRPDRKATGTGAPWLVVVSVLLGLSVRCGLILISHTSKAWPDHHEYVRWGTQASTRGLLTLYTAPPPEIDIRLSDERQARVRHRVQYICNYPPLAVYVFALQGAVHGALDPDRVSNTRAARFTYSAAAALADLLLAAGCAAIVRSFLSRRAGHAAFALAFLMPPIMLDSCYWGQTDSWVLAPAVWMVHFMTCRRWIAAGLLWGTALALKTQAILLAPIWVFAWLLDMRRRRVSGTHHDTKGITLGLGGALLWLNLLAMPFWWTSGSAWLHNSVVRNLRDEAPNTTLKAFNVWYVDLLLSEDPATDRVLLGVQKDTWGKGLAVAGLIAAGALAWRSGSAAGHQTLLFSALWLLFVVMFPTRVHERYVLLCLPFILCVACVRPRFRVGLVALVVVATCQVLVYQWMSFGAGTWPEYEQGARDYHTHALQVTPPELRDQLPTFERAMQLAREEYARMRSADRPREWALTILSLGGFVLILWAATNTRSQPQTPKLVSPKEGFAPDKAMS